MPNAIGFAKFYGRSHAAVTRVYDDVGNVIVTHEYKGEVQRAVRFYSRNLSRERIAPINTRNLWSVFEQKVRRLVGTFA